MFGPAFSSTCFTNDGGLHGSTRRRSTAPGLKSRLASKSARAIAKQSLWQYMKCDAPTSQNVGWLPTHLSARRKMQLPGVIEARIIVTVVLDAGVEVPTVAGARSRGGCTGYMTRANATSKTHSLSMRQSSQKGWTIAQSKLAIMFSFRRPMSWKRGLMDRRHLCTPEAAREYIEAPTALVTFFYNCSSHPSSSWFPPKFLSG